MTRPLGCVLRALCDVTPEQPSRRRYRLLQVETSSGATLRLQTWAPNATAAHAESGRLWLFLTGHTGLDWDVVVSEWSPGVFDGDDWVEVQLNARGEWSAERVAEEALNITEATSVWATSEYAQEEQGLEVIQLERGAQPLVVCHHCDDVLAAIETGRRCSCQRVAFRCLESEGGRKLWVRTPYGTVFSVLKFPLRSLDALAPGEPLVTQCHGRYTAAG